MIRKIEYAVGTESITPAALQAAGIQGEHNATELHFTLSDDLYQSLTTGTGTLFYRFDAETSSGHSIITPSNNLTGKVIILPLSEEFTRDGGTVKITLAITEVASDFTSEQEVYSHACHIRLDSKDNYEIGAVRRSITGIEQEILDAAKRSEDAANAAVPAAERTVRAQRQLELGDFFIFDGNGSVNPTLTIDTNFNADSENPATSAAIAGYVDGKITTELNNIGDNSIIDADTYDAHIAKIGAIKSYVASKINAAISAEAMLGFMYPVGAVIDEYEIVPTGEDAQGITSIEIQSGNYAGYFELFIGTQKLPGYWEKIEARMTIGAGTSSGGTVYNVGDIGGIAEITINANNLPPHTHPQNVTANRDSGGTANRTDFNADGSGYRAFPQGTDTEVNSTENNPINIMNPYVVVNKWHRIHEISQNTEE